MAVVHALAPFRQKHGSRLLCADNYDWCIVPDSGFDIIVFAGVAVVVSCLFRGKFSNLMILVAGTTCRVLFNPKTLAICSMIAICSTIASCRWSTAGVYVSIQPGAFGQWNQLVAWHTPLRVVFLYLSATFIV